MPDITTETDLLALAHEADDPAPVPESAAGPATDPLPAEEATDPSGDPAQDLPEDPWGAQRERETACHPALAQPGSPLRTATEALLTADPALAAAPDGYARAVQYATWQLEAGSAAGLQARVQSLTAEVQRLNQLTSIPGAGPTRPVQVRSFAELTPEEQERELLQRAADFDRTIEFV